MSKKTNNEEIENLIITSSKDEEKLRKAAGELEKFTPEMFDINLMNVNNREFMCVIFDDFGSKFDVSEETTAAWAIEMACKVGSTSMVKRILNNNKSVKGIQYIAEADEEIFNLLKKQKSNISDEAVVDIIVKTAVHSEARIRLAYLKKWGYNLEAKNSAGQTAKDILRARLGKVEAKGKKGVSEKGNISRGINLIDATVKGDNVVTTYKGNLISGIIVIVVAAAVALAIFISKTEEKKDSSGETTSNKVQTSSEETTSDKVQTSSEETETMYTDDENYEIKNGDMVDIDYVGSIDGVEFDGGNTHGQGTTLTIGSGSYIDDFEEQLIGHKPGETVDVYATFPEDYSKGQESKAHLDGKEALFKVTINGVYTEKE